VEDGPGNVPLLPDDASPADVMDTENRWRVTTHLPMTTRNTRRKSPETFMEYLMTQEEHISQYYTQVEFDIVPIQLYRMLKSTNKVLLATDGGAIPLKESLGFVISDEEGTILIKCFGQPSGIDPLSFRSEICALLAATRFITYLVKYYDERIQCDEPTRSKIQIYTDSLSMMKKLKAYDEYPTAPLRTVLDSEWDVLSALHRALKWFPSPPKINWVKSHQDDQVYDKSEMPPDAYLNSEADELATTGLKRLQKKQIVLMDPATIIQFHIEERTITRYFKRTVREIIQLPSLRKFYCKRFGWSNNIFGTIDWDIFRPVYKKYTSNKGVQ
jgi:hypothetical protein